MPDRTHRTNPETKKKVTIGSSRGTSSSESNTFVSNPKDEVKELVKQEEETPVLKQFDRSGYDQGRELGKGAFGTVYEMAPKEEGKKKMALKTSNSKDGNDDLKQEAEVLQKLGEHENIVGLGGIEETSQGTNLALEYLGGGDMQKMQDQLQAAYKARKISHEQYWGTLQYLLRGVSSGIGHMNEQGLVHGDLKGGNVGISEDMTPKVIDFGTVADVDTKGSGAMTPVINMAPERLDGTVQKNNDVYAIGQMAHASGHDGKFHAQGNGGYAGPVFARQEELQKGKDGTWSGFGDKTAYDDFLNQTLAPTSDTRTEAKNLGGTDFLSDSLGSDEMAKATMRQMLDERSGVEKKGRSGSSFDYGPVKSELDLVKESKDNRDTRLAQARVQNKAEKKSGKEALKEAKTGHTKKEIGAKSDMLKELKKKTKGTRKALDKDGDKRRQAENLRLKTEKKNAKKK